MKYRELTPKDVAEVVAEYNRAGDVAIARQIIKDYFGSNAHKVFIKYDSKYNDEGYDITCVVIVLDKDMRELDCKGGYDICQILLRKLHERELNSDFGFQDEPDPLTFLMAESKGLPKLYMLEEEYEQQ